MRRSEKIHQIGCEKEPGSLIQHPMSRRSAEERNISPTLDLSIEGRQPSDQGEVYGF
jgi:hypothetical protein